MLMVIRLKHFLLIIIGFLIITSSCNSGKDSDLSHKTSNYPELKPPFRIGVNQIQEKDSTFDIELNKFKERLIKSIQIQNPILQFEYQNRWKICYKVNSGKNFDIYVVEQTDEKDASSLMLITTQKANPQNIISAVMVGLENYIENPNKIEAEDWSAFIDENLSIKVLKKYETIISSNNENLIDLSENSNIKKSIDEIEETYKINDDGSIVFVDKAIFNKQSAIKQDLSYRAVIAFNKINSDDNIENSDEWMINNVEIQNACQLQNILFIQTYDNFNNVLISNNEGIQLDTIDISIITEKMQKGYVLVHSKMDPKFIEYSNKNEIIKAISDYFNIDLYIEE